MAGSISAAALAHAPEIAAYGLLAMAPLGPHFAASASALSLLASAVGTGVAATCGAGRLLSGPRASQALLTAGLLATLVGHVPGIAATPAAALVLVALGLSAAGLLQIAFGLLRLGTVVKFTPYPVRAGMVSGVGLLLISTALPVLTGHGFGSRVADALASANLGASVVGLAALIGTWVAARLRWPVPAVLMGLAVAAVLHAALASADLLPGMGVHIAVPDLPVPWLPDAAAVRQALRSAAATSSVFGSLASFAGTVAVLATLDTLLTASVVDGRARLTRDANRELVAQGCATIAAAAAAGQASSPSVVRSLSLSAQRPAPRHAALGYAGALLAVLVLAPQLLGLLPASAIGGVLLLQGLQMIAPSLWQTPWQVSGMRPTQRMSPYDRAQRILLAENWLVTVAVALATVLLGLAAAVLVGASFAVLLFVRANMREVVSRVRTGETHRSLKVRPPELAAALQREGRRIAVLDLEGALFFGTADALRARLDGLLDATDTAILDLHRVVEIDATGARILLETGDDWARRGKVLVAAEWLPDDPRRRTVEALAAHDKAIGLHFAADTDRALEQAEEWLLERLRLESGPTRRLHLEETMLGRGLDAQGLAILGAEMTTVEFPRDAVLFRVDDPGDAIFVSLQGHIGLRLPGSSRRLASFAPGVILGEMAVLSRRPRSAEAVAETELTALRLSVDGFDRLRTRHPEVAAQILDNIAVHLADRVRMLTAELSGWVSRSAGSRVRQPAAAAPVEGNG